MRKEEYGLIGSILIDSSVLKDVCMIATPDMFEDEILGECYRVMLALYDMNKPVNVVSIATEMENRERDRATVQDALMKCAVDVVTSVKAKEYAYVLKNAYKARTAKNIINGKEIYPNNVNQSVGAIINELEALMKDRSVNSMSMKEIAEKYSSDFFCDHDDGISTGFYKLDTYITLEGGNIYVIGARPSVGKSAFSNQIIIQICRKGKRVGYYNLEMTEKQVLARMVSQLSGIRMDRMKHARAFLGDEEILFKKAVEIVSDFDLTVISGKTTLSELKQVARHQEFDLIVIDYLQLLKSERQYANRSAEVGYISKTLKEIAIELNVPIIVLSQLNRASEQRETKEPSMSELRESGDIEQDASVIMLLWNMTEDRKNKGLKIDKNRDGELGKIVYKFSGETVFFDEQNEDFDSYVRKIDAYKKSAEDLRENTSDCPFN